MKPIVRIKRGGRAIGFFFITATFFFLLFALFNTGNAGLLAGLAAASGIGIVCGLGYFILAIAFNEP